MSAARAAARNKPVIVVKAGRAPAAARKAAASHTGALAGSDVVFDAAIRRAGMLRVDTLQELFDRGRDAGALRRGNRGDRLTIMTNGGGAGVMAADAAAPAAWRSPSWRPRRCARARRGAAADLVARQPGRHHRRRAGRSATPTRCEALLARPERRRACCSCTAPTAIVPQRRHRARLRAAGRAQARGPRDGLLARRRARWPRRAGSSRGAGVPTTTRPRRRCAPSCMLRRPTGATRSC